MKTIQDIPFHAKTKIIFENDRIFVVDKPAGVLSHPNDAGDYSSSVITCKYDSKKEFFDVDQWKVFLLHRIDKETSGCLMFAKDALSARLIKADFENQKVFKEYTALLCGLVRKPDLWKDNMIKKGKVMVVDQRGKSNAITKVKPLEVFSKPKFTLTKFFPESGRTHQLRVQSAHRHYPILGDRQYGNFTRNKEAKQKWDFNRMFLHASVVEFIDPGTSKKIRVTSDLPAELQEVLDFVGNIR